MKIHRLGILLAILFAFALYGAASAQSPNPNGNGQGNQGRGQGAENSARVSLQILAINDFHGNIDTLSTVNGVPAGGAEYLATNFRTLEAQNPNTVIVSAGDLIGASPLISALFHDEPTIEAAGLFGLDINAVGNHEFDDGAAELLRMQYGGCHPVDGCQDGDPFGGAQFQFLAANVLDNASGATLFPAFKVMEFQGVRVAFIGLTLEGTPTIVTPTGVAGLTFRDEADTINALVAELRRANIESIVVLIHEGGVQVGSGIGPNTCVGISGPIVDIVNRTDPAVDLFITGHTHQNYNCRIGGRPVTSTNAFGRFFTKIDIELNRVTKDMTVLAVDNRLNDRAVGAAPDLTTLVTKYRTLVAPLANRVIGSITADILRAANAAGESALGDVIADSQLAATAPAALGGAVIAFMNPGGIRADLTFAQVSGGEAPGKVTYGEAFTVQPFGNSLVTLDLTGAQIDTLLEQQFNNPSPGQNRILQVSNGFSYAWSASAPAGSRVDPASIMLNGVPLNPAAVYRVTVNSFLADGGDNFTVLIQGTNRVGGAQDLDALSAYFAANVPVAPGPMNRITRLP